MNPYLESNKKLWDDWTDLHESSGFYNVQGFLEGEQRLDAIELELGVVKGKSLLHLQCHFGMSTLSWARLGAQVTGADFSENSIALAKRLAQEIKIDANFVCANLYDLPKVLQGEFDFVFTSHGVLSWLPDLAAWAKIVAHFLKSGGTFYIVEAHPTAFIFDDEDKTDLRVRYSYFPKPEPDLFEVKGSYAAPESDYSNVEYYWAHSMSEIVNALIDAGLHIESLREYPFLSWQMYPFMEMDAEGWWHLPKLYPPLPMMFSLKASKP